MTIDTLSCLIKDQVTDFETHSILSDSNSIYLTDGCGVDFNITVYPDCFMLLIGIWNDVLGENEFEEHKCDTSGELIELLNTLSRSNFD